MKICLLSDTHGLDYSDLLLSRIQVVSPDLIIHLGDYYPDAESFIDKGYAVIRVPGTWTSYYQNPVIENRRIEVFEDWRFLLSHTPEVDYHDLPDDPDPQVLLDAGLCDVFCHGHTHQASLDMDGEVIICNPGHLSIKDKRSKPSFAVIDLNVERLAISIQDLESSDLLFSEVFEKS